MKIKDILKSEGKPFPSVEIVPPLSGMSKEDLFNSIDPLMEYSPRYINVTRHREEVVFREEADGTFSRHMVRNRVSETAVCGAIMARYGVEVVPHMICAGHTTDQTAAKLKDFAFLGIENVIALRGDSMVGEKRFTPTPGGFSHADELVRMIKEGGKEGTDFSVGVGGYPEKHFEAPNLETDIENLKRKVDAGADYVITQMFFDNNTFYSFRDKCREAGITVPIIPGIKPLSTLRHVELLPQSFSIDLPAELTDEVMAHKDDKGAIYRIGTLWAINQCKDLLKHDVPAIHLYTMGKAGNICEILKECF